VDAEEAKAVNLSGKNEGRTLPNYEMEKEKIGQTADVVLRSQWSREDQLRPESRYNSNGPGPNGIQLNPNEFGERMNLQGDNFWGSFMSRKQRVIPEWEKNCVKNVPNYEKNRVRLGGEGKKFKEYDPYEIGRLNERMLEEEIGGQDTDKRSTDMEITRLREKNLNSLGDGGTTNNENNTTLTSSTKFLPPSRTQQKQSSSSKNSYDLQTIEDGFNLSTPTDYRPHQGGFHAQNRDVTCIRTGTRPGQVKIGEWAPLYPCRKSPPKTYNENPEYFLHKEQCKTKSQETKQQAKKMKERCEASSIVWEHPVNYYDLPELQEAKLRQRTDMCDKIAMEDPRKEAIRKKTGLGFDVAKVNAGKHSMPRSYKPLNIFGEW